MSDTRARIERYKSPWEGRKGMRGWASHRLYRMRGRVYMFNPTMTRLESESAPTNYSLDFDVHLLDHNLQDVIDQCHRWAKKNVDPLEGKSHWIKEDYGPDYREKLYIEVLDIETLDFEPKVETTCVVCELKRD